MFAMSEFPEPSRELLSRVIDSLGDDTFHSAMIDYLSTLFGGLNGLAMRYYKSARPQLLINQVLDDGVRDLYLNGLYRLDPLNNIDRTNFTAGAFSFRESFEIDSDTIKYHEEVFQRARISDELAWVVMMPDASMQAYCLDKPDGQFSSAEVQLARSELSVVKSLTLKHFSLAFLGKLKAGPVPSTTVERIVHLASDQTTESARWRPELSLLADTDKLLVEQDALAVRRNGGFRESKLRCDASLSTCSLLLESEHYLLQRILPSHEVNAEDYKGMIGKALGPFMLTEREADVVYLSLLGYPNALIARKLGISSGTVKNHKYSIYNKLDITSERELFNLVLKNIVGLRVTP